MRVLLIEDDERIVDFVQRGLKAEGYFVEVARNGLDAIDLATDSVFQIIILTLAYPTSMANRFANVCASKATTPRF